MATEEKFDDWVILEIDGYRKLAGKATEATIAGAPLLRIDIPLVSLLEDGKKFFTQYYAPGHIYCITPTTETIARAYAAHHQPVPAEKWDLQIPERAAGYRGVEVEEG